MHEGMVSIKKEKQVRKKRSWRSRRRRKEGKEAGKRSGHTVLLGQII